MNERLLGELRRLAGPWPTYDYSGPYTFTDEMILAVPVSVSAVTAFTGDGRPVSLSGLAGGESRQA